MNNRFFVLPSLLFCALMVSIHTQAMFRLKLFVDEEENPQFCENARQLKTLLLLYEKSNETIRTIKNLKVLSEKNCKSFCSACTDAERTLEISRKYALCLDPGSCVFDHGFFCKTLDVFRVKDDSKRR